MYSSSPTEEYTGQAEACWPIQLAIRVAGEVPHRWVATSRGGRDEEPAKHAEQHEPPNQRTSDPEQQHWCSRACCCQGAHGVVKLPVRIGQPDVVDPIGQCPRRHDNDQVRGIRRIGDSKPDRPSLDDCVA